jgi:hypothetical protein
MILDKFKEQLRDMSTHELEAVIAQYQESPSRGITDEVLLGCYEAEMERRFLAWEAAE